MLKKMINTTGKAATRQDIRFHRRSLDEALKAETLMGAIPSARQECEASSIGRRDEVDQERSSKTQHLNSRRCPNVKHTAGSMVRSTFKNLEHSETDSHDISFPTGVSQKADTTPIAGHKGYIFKPVSPLNRVLFKVG